VPERVARAGIARTFQNIRLFSELSALDNVLVGMDAHLRSRGWDAVLRLPRHRRESAWAQTRALEILTRVGFPGDRRDEPTENLSRGMQQKVALARALLTAPILLLLDEPTTGLDPRSKQEVQEFIREVRAEHDATILLCTHDLAEAEYLADRVGILDNGELLCLEPADQLKARYDSTTLEEAFFAASGHAFENGDGGDK
jgi:ABC-type branched-subunit amino acid transport system ATPase component